MKVLDKEYLPGILAALCVVYAVIIPVFSGVNWSIVALFEPLVIAWPYYFMILLTAMVVCGTIRGLETAYYLGIVFFGISAIFFGLSAVAFFPGRFMYAPLIEAIVSVMIILALILLLKEK